MNTQDKVDAVHIAADALSFSDDRYDTKDIVDAVDTVLTQIQQVNDDTNNTPTPAKTEFTTPAKTS